MTSIRSRIHRMVAAAESRAGAEREGSRLLMEALASAWGALRPGAAAPAPPRRRRPGESPEGFVDLLLAGGPGCYAAAPSPGADRGTR